MTPRDNATLSDRRRILILVLGGVLTLPALGSAVSGVVIAGGGVLPIYVLALSAAAVVLLAGGALRKPRYWRVPRLVLGALIVPNLVVLPWIIWFSPLIQDVEAIGAVQMANFLVLIATPLVVVVGAPRPERGGSGAHPQAE